MAKPSMFNVSFTVPTSSCPNYWDDLSREMGGPAKIGADASTQCHSDRCDHCVVDARCRPFRPEGVPLLRSPTHVRPVTANCKGFSASSTCPRSSVRVHDATQSVVRTEEISDLLVAVSSRPADRGGPVVNTVVRFNDGPALKKEVDHRPVALTGGPNQRCGAEVGIPSLEIGPVVQQHCGNLESALSVVSRQGGGSMPTERAPGGH